MINKSFRNCYAIGHRGTVRGSSARFLSNTPRPELSLADALKSLPQLICPSYLSKVFQREVLIHLSFDQSKRHYAFVEKDYACTQGEGLRERAYAVHPRASFLVGWAEMAGLLETSASLGQLFHHVPIIELSSAGTTIPSVACADHMRNIWESAVVGRTSRARRLCELLSDRRGTEHLLY